ncbi:hypothetical protein ILUMI_22732 [Ignelater luminosus]|uniref:RNA-directed DNA polymerase n=1 Tax=Ignelater luminosus TaxID=2038154 RepID=A0A8K0CG32_IGNLU|nr:hypothetical protein ILUMI_22732 [Ignelater luminosus]
MMADVNQLSALLGLFVNQQSELLASFRSQASSAPSPQPSQTFNFEQFDESKEDSKLKAQILINCIGSKYYQLLLCLTSPETLRDKTYSELVTLIENRLCPQPNECIEQHKFLSRMQAGNKTIAQYTVALRKLSSTCNFVCPEPTCKKSIAQVFLQAQFIRGLSDPTIREKLLQEKDLTFGNATKIALALEASKLGNRVLSSSTEGEVNKVTVLKPPRRQNSTSKNSTYTNRKPHKTKFKINYADLGLDGICLRCGLNNHLLDREATAIYWSFHRFYPYIYGRKFTLVTDNKPLCHIFSPKKKLPEIKASRLLRYALFLSGFDYEIKYRRSQEHGNADYLSRALLPVISNSTDIEYEICKLTINQIFTDIVTHKFLSKETECDPELFSLKQDLLNGTCLSIEFSPHDGVIFRGDRVVIPQTIQPYVLNELHSTHQGVVRMKNLARQFCYWKNMDKQIEKLSKCSVCFELKNDPVKVPFHIWELPQSNWERVHIDYAGPFLNHHFLVVVDSLSKRPEVSITQASPITAVTISMLQEIFSRNGLPTILVSDNAAIFTSEAFTSFCQRNGIQHKTIAPGHPARNGQAERFVQTLKVRLKSLVSEQGSLREKLNKILFYYRATSLFSGGKSPAENFLGRNLRTRLDLLHFQAPRSQNPNLQPAVPPSRILRLGDRVQSRNYGSSMHWKCGTVVDVLGRLHYLIELDDGYVIKRHIDQLRRTKVSPETITNRKILPNVTSLPDQTLATQNMLGRHHPQAEVVCKQPPFLLSDCSGEAAPQLTSAMPSQTSVEESPANATPVVSTPSSQPRKSTTVRKPVV